MQEQYINELFQYLENKKNYYNWEQSKWQEIESGFHLLLKRIRDKKLYLGIVGEFSSGKSTFINALLGLDVLKEDVLAGTTCAPTMICYGEKFDVEIYKKTTNMILRYSEDRSFFKRMFCSIRSKIGIAEYLQKQLTEAKSFIYKYTADEVFAQDVSKVVLYLPCKNPIFDNDIVIVDTPGINADNHRHQEVTEKTIRDLCDLAIVLTPAPAPCSQTLLNFINEHLSSFQKNCICLASQIDRIRKKERDRQIKYIVSRFQSENIYFSQIYPISAYYVIHHDENAEKDEVKELQEQFYHTISEICELLKKNKNLVLKDKIYYILEYIVKFMLTPILENTMQEVHARFEELDKNQLVDFSTFLLNNKNELIKNFSAYHPHSYDIKDIVKITKDKFIMQFYTAIDEAVSVSDLKKIMSQKNIENYMNSLQTEYIQLEVVSFQNRIDTIGVELLEQFHKKFNNEFRNLVRYNNNSILKMQTNMESSSAFVPGELETISISVNNLRGVAAGGVAGAVIGSLMLPIPVVGTLVGSFVGSLIGSFIGKKTLSAYKTEAKDIIIKNAEKWCDMLENKLYNEIIQPYFIKKEQQLCSFIDAYEIYRPEVEEIIKAEKQQLNMLQEKMIQCNKDYKYFQELIAYINR